MLVVVALPWSTKLIRVQYSGPALWAKFDGAGRVVWDTSVKCLFGEVLKLANVLLAGMDQR